MNRRGFTLLELLAAIGVSAIALVILASAVKSQGSNTIYQMGTADMQQNVRGALDLFRREVRMAGYGMSSVPSTVLPILTVPAAGAGELYHVNLYGNYNYVKTRVAAAGAAQATNTVPLGPFSAAACLSGTPAKTFTVGQRVSIESALRGVAEVYTITGYDAVNCNITVTPALVGNYEFGSPVNEIQQVSYKLDSQNVLSRLDTAGNWIVTADQIDAMQMQYILDDGTSVADPSAVLPKLRSASISMHSQMSQHDDLQPQAALQSEVRIRNLDIVRTPAIDDL